MASSSCGSLASAATTSFAVNASRFSPRSSGRRGSGRFAPAGLFRIRAFFAVWYSALASSHSLRLAPTFSTASASAWRVASTRSAAAAVHSCSRSSARSSRRSRPSCAARTATSRRSAAASASFSASASALFDGPSSACPPATRCARRSRSSGGDLHDLLGRRDRVRLRL